MASTVIVSGARGGIGSACARMLVDQGYNVVLADLDGEGAHSLAADLGPTAKFCALDVTSEQDWTRVWAEATEAFGVPTKLVNAAGIIRRGPMVDVTAEEFQLVTAVNQLGTFLGLKTAGTHMPSAGGGAIVNIGSIAAVRGLAGSVAYGASKWAVRGLTFTAAHELGPLGIRVNCVHPGPIRTAMTEHYTPDMFAASPMRRMGDPEEVAEVVAFLLSERSGFVTGTELMIDGGLSLPVAVGPPPS
jgi:3alpha(or 20beta)-hydroxysteroid dehydrogenase